MSATAVPPLRGVDHVHVFVGDRAAAVRWYARVLGLAPVAALQHWTADGGPLTLADASAGIHLALFERPLRPNRATLALAISAPDWPRWREHLAAQGVATSFEDHGQSWSLYFADPDGNPYELTCYEVDALRGGSQAAINHCADQ